MTDAVECVVIGAGVVGLAVARAIAWGGREVVVLEKERWIGSETSSRNSEVIHAGLHYAKGSLKARFCVAGRDRLYAYCAARGIPHKRLGKLTVATREEELPTLEGVWRKAAANGVADLEWVSGNEARALEPELSCRRAFLSPSTGIIDSHALMLAYQVELEAAGGMAVLRAPVVAGRVIAPGFALQVGGAEPMALDCRFFVKSARIHELGPLRPLPAVPPSSHPSTD